MIEFCDKKKKLVVITTVSKWDEPPRIRHQIAFQLSRFYNVLYVQLYNYESPKKINDSIIVAGFGYYIRGMMTIFSNMPKIEIIYKNYLYYSIRLLVKKLKYSEAILINFQYDIPEICKKSLFKVIIYFCNDDFVNMDEALSVRKKKYINIRQRKVINNSDAVIAVSEPLVQLLKKENVEPILLLPGTEIYDQIREWEEIKNNPIKKYISVAYMGYINNRINLDWINEVIKNDDIIFELIGPIDEIIKDKLKNKSNLKINKSETGIELVKKMSKMDVLVMPYDENKNGARLTTAPNKFYQYMATGLPVVISNMPNFIQTPDFFVYRAKTADQFVEMIRKAVQDDTYDLRKERRQYARNNSWEKRGDKLYEIIKNIYKEKNK
jgi:glycosyltransferase involved in cell wall biosynthesis